ncbi:hypothetical protein [Kitasatospora cineracea]|uniref:hypothetical protein n=1 Tax=Kitasatospora cineracea TaxID=88074 RepID=UPI0037F8417D
MAKPHLTHPEHAARGAVIAGIRDELQHRSTQLGTAYPTPGPEAEPRRHLLHAITALDKARSAPDSRLFAEHPDTADPAVYYPAQKNRATITLPGPPRGDGLPSATSCPGAVPAAL